MSGPGESGLRLLSWNVHSLRDDVDAVAAVLRAVRPDVVCLQEAPRFGCWRAALADLAHRSELFVTCGGATTTGPALLAALPVDVEHTWETRLSRTPRLHRRGLAAARLRARGRTWLVASAHLGLDADERRRHAAEIVGRLASWRDEGDAAVVLGCDLNEEPGSPAWRLLLGEGGVSALGLRDAYAEAPAGGELTFPARAPRWRIDAVLVAGADALGCGVPELDAGLLRRASDHRPVLARLAARPPVAKEESVGPGP